MNENKKVAIITSAGTGIGAAIAIMLAKKDWRVVLTGRTLATLKQTAEKIRALGGEASCVVVDVSSSAYHRKPTQTC